MTKSDLLRAAREAVDEGLPLAPDGRGRICPWCPSWVESIEDHAINCPWPRMVVAVEALPEPDDGTPFGWNDWIAWQATDEYADLLKTIRQDIARQDALGLALSVENLASCAFSAGMQVYERRARAEPGGDEGDGPVVDTDPLDD
jgi:hypothetical protein